MYKDMCWCNSVDLLLSGRRLFFLVSLFFFTTNQVFNVFFPVGLVTALNNSADLIQALVSLTLTGHLKREWLWQNSVVKVILHIATIISIQNARLSS